MCIPSQGSEFLCDNSNNKSNYRKMANIYIYKTIEKKIIWSEIEIKLLENFFLVILDFRVGP